VNKITGWNKEDLRQAREQELITWTKTSEDGIRYDINSIPERLFIKKAVRRCERRNRLKN
jgi:hypothetical protein